MTDAELAQAFKAGYRHAREIRAIVGVFRRRAVTKSETATCALREAPYDEWSDYQWVLVGLVTPGGYTLTYRN